MSFARPILRSNRQVDLLAQPGQVVFTFPLPLFDAADLSVYQRIGTGDVTRLLLGFGVALTPDGQGIVTFDAAPVPGNASPSAPPVIIRLAGRRVAERLLDVTRGGTISSTALEAELDRQAIIAQELRRDIDDRSTSDNAFADATARAEAAATNTAADRVQTGLDRAQTGSDVTAANQAAAASGTSAATASGAAGTATTAAASATAGAATANNAALLAQAFLAGKIFANGTATNPLPAAVTAAVADGGFFGIYGPAGGNILATLYQRSGTSGVPLGLAIASRAELTSAGGLAVPVVDTVANLPANAPVLSLAIVDTDVIPINVTGRLTSNGLAQLNLNVAASSVGLAIGSMINVRGVGAAYDGYQTLKAAGGASVSYLTGGPTESLTAVSGAVLDRNGVYLCAAPGDWTYVGDIGSDALTPARDKLRRETASIRRSFVPNDELDRLFAPALTPRKLVATIGQTINLQADCLVPGSTPKFFVDNVLVGYGAKNAAGPHWSCPWNAPAAPQISTVSVQVEGARRGSGNVVVAEANRLNPDLTTWSRTNIASVTGGYADPDGGTNAYRVVCAASGSAVQHYLSATASPVSAGPNSGFEIWARADTTAILGIADASSVDLGFVNPAPASGETWSKFVNIHIVERRGPWCRVWWSQKNGGTPASQFLLHLVTALGTLTNVSDGSEAILLYAPRAIDAQLPFDNYQKAAIRAGSVSYADRWLTRSEFVDSTASQTDINVDVVVPDAYDPSKRWPVLYVCEVESTPGTSYLDGLQTIKGMGLHNIYGFILARNYFPSADVSWYASRSDGTAQHDLFVRDVVTKLVDDRYSTIRNREGRMLIGFSKSGWGAVSLLLRNPFVYGYAAAWDVPFGLQYSGQDNYEFDAYGAAKQFGNTLYQQSATGSQANYQAYNPADILAANLAAVNDRPRLALGGSVVWDGDLQYFRRLLDANGVPYAYRKTPQTVTNGTDHNWVPGSNAAAAWLAQLIGMMAALR